MLINSPKISRFTLLGLGLLVASGVTGMLGALILGIIFSQLFSVEKPHIIHQLSSLILKTSIVILGATLNIHDIWQVASESFGITLLTIVATILAGAALGKLFNRNKNVTTLISGGTAICGASAIAALAPTIQADKHQIAVSMAIVFLLNAIGLWSFPLIGQWLDLTEHQFGLWAALAIHDTSSVIGAASIYGDDALAVATTTKLARALWIIPLVLGASFMHSKAGKLTQLPIFIVLFIVSSLISSFVALPLELLNNLKFIASSGMAVALLLIGCGFNKDMINSLTWKTLSFAILLWVTVATFSLWLIL